MIIFLATGALAITKRQFIKDYFVVATTDIELSAERIGSAIKLTEDGDFLYQASQTQVQSADQFQQSCRGIEKQTIVLGCYTNQRIYIFDVKDKRLEGVKEVTAAHELLHAVYERLPDEEKQRVNQLLAQQRKSLREKQVKETLALYSELSKEDFNNEMYAIFGTEVKDLSIELEKHYANYFTDRKKIVAFAEQYQSVFRQLQEKADALKSQYETLNNQKKSLETQLNSLQQSIQNQQTELNRLRQSDVEAYNQRVPGFNADVNQYNALVAQYRALINQMNQVIEELNKNSTELNQLNKEIDSRYQAL